jgi:hypothetical protein
MPRRIGGSALDRMARPPEFGRIPGEKACDLGLFGCREEDDELEAQEEDGRKKQVKF